MSFPFSRVLEAMLLCSRWGQVKDGTERVSHYRLCSLSVTGK